MFHAEDKVLVANRNVIHTIKIAAFQSSGMDLVLFLQREILGINATKQVQKPVKN